MTRSAIRVLPAPPDARLSPLAARNLLARVGMDFARASATGARFDRLAPVASPGEIAQLLREGALPADCVFDRFLPLELRVISGKHWTPLQVAASAARWLRTAGVHTVVDIGSGAGKFCVAAALAGQGRFIGVERRPRLVAAARRLARAFGIQDRVRFHVASMGDSDIPSAEAYYLFNPFAEGLYGREDHIDDDVDAGEARHAHAVRATCRLLQRAPLGTFVITYHGFGGKIPGSYDVVGVDRAMPGVLRMWKKVREDQDLRSG